jgi:hypothetical protein
MASSTQSRNFTLRATPLLHGIAHLCSIPIHPSLNRTGIPVRCSSVIGHRSLLIHICSSSIVPRYRLPPCLRVSRRSCPSRLTRCSSLTPQPTPQEREQGIGTKWARKGLWWFRFEIKSTLPDERTGKIVTLATKDASDHTFAVKTANWGWQQFSKRDQLFLNSSVLASDSFVIICTIQAQPQPPAGYWLGMGLPPNSNWLGATTSVGNRPVGSGGGLSAWSGGEGASGGVAGGTTAAGGVKRVVPKELVSAVGSLLDDEREYDQTHV